MPSIVINEMRGLNTSRARLQLKPGEAGALQNVRQRPFDNWAKRKGVETALVQDDPVNGIFEWDMDEIVMGAYQTGGTLTFYPEIPITSTSVGGTVTTITPSPEPVYDPLDPTGTGTAGGISFGVEQAMRALQERVCRRGGSPINWPNAAYNASGGASSVVCATVPLSTFYGSSSTAVDMPQPGLYQYDCYYDSAYRTSLVQSVVDALDAEATVWLQVYPEGQTALTTFTSSTLWGGAKPTVTATNYLSVMAQVRTAMKGLMYYAAGASFTSQYTRETGSVVWPTCDEAKTESLSNWASATWNSGSGGCGVYEVTWNNVYVGKSVSQGRYRAKVTQDLSSFKSANGACFLKATAQAGGFSNTSDCPVTADAKYHQWQIVTVGQVVTSDYINNNDTPPSFSSDCPVTAITKGWTLTPTIILFFRFTYSV